MKWKKSKPLSRAEKERLHEGFVMMGNALAEDMKEAQGKVSGLPKDWRNRIFKAQGT